MYESFFGLARRPFLTTPDPDCFATHESIGNALAGLRLCVEAGQGFGILSAPAGTGKTLLCRKLIVDLRDRFATVFLAHSNFPTRRSLLQAILYELGHPYIRMAEQELRLELKTAVTGLPPEKSGVLLVVDEAHRLNYGLLEEIRTAVNLDRDGRPLFRVVLSGQLALEEKLAGPELEALNQRIACQVTLDPLTRAESADYVAYRLCWAGAAIEDVFEPDALEVICHAADGVPRCLNQLCDHTLMLSYAAGVRPVESSIVREALEDLKQLPLHWNEPPPALAPSDECRPQTTTELEDSQPRCDEQPEAFDSSLTEGGGVIGVGAIEVGQIEVGDDLGDQGGDAHAPSEETATPERTDAAASVAASAALIAADASENEPISPTPAKTVVEIGATSSVELDSATPTDDDRHSAADEPVKAVVEVGGDPAERGEHSGLNQTRVSEAANAAAAGPAFEDNETLAAQTASSTDVESPAASAPSTFDATVQTLPETNEESAAYEEEFVVDRYAMLDAGSAVSRPIDPGQFEAGTAGGTATSAATASRRADSLSQHGIDLTTADFGHSSAVARTPDQLIDAIEPIVSDALEEFPLSHGAGEPTVHATSSRGSSTPGRANFQARSANASTDEEEQGNRSLHDVPGSPTGDALRADERLGDDSPGPAEADNCSARQESQAIVESHVAGDDAYREGSYDVVRPECPDTGLADRARTDYQTCPTEKGSSGDGPTLTPHASPTESDAGSEDRHPSAETPPRGRYAHLFSQLRRRQQRA